MIKLSKLTDYATVILCYIAKEQVQVRGALEIAEATGIALPTVGKILKILAKAKVLESTRGAKGGYVLARKPQHISVADVIAALEGPIALTECTISKQVCEQAKGCGIQGNWQLINQRISEALAAVTVADLLAPGAQAESLHKGHERFHAAQATPVLPKEIFIPVSRLFETKA